jgi:hypothetical protein
MDVIVGVPTYDPGRGFSFVWDDGFEIAMKVTNVEVTITANSAGLVTLARHLLTLAQDSARPGMHLHLTANQEVDSSLDLLIERAVD